MERHVHLSPVGMLVTFAFVVAALGTMHLLAITSDTRPARALLAMGF